MKAHFIACFPHTTPLPVSLERTPVFMRKKKRLNKQHKHSAVVKMLVQVEQLAKKDSSKKKINMNTKRALFDPQDG